MKVLSVGIVFSVIVSMSLPSVSSEELVRGGNLDDVENRLADIENHHLDLEHEEDLLQGLKQSVDIHQTETIMEVATNKDVYNNKWAEPRAPEDEYTK